MDDKLNIFRKSIQSSVVVCIEKSWNWPAVWEPQGPLSLIQNVKTPHGLRLTWTIHLVIPYLLSIFAQALCWVNPIWWLLIFQVQHALNNPALH